jgi:hypothetical protein
VRAISVFFAVASIPVGGALLAHLAGRRTALVAPVLVAASWVTLFHGIYGRMYSLFLFTSALSLLAFVRAVAGNRRLTWALFALASLAMVSTHQYGAFVLAIEACYLVLMRLRGSAKLMPGVVAFAAVAVAAIPVWRSTLVLASRFDVGVGAGRQLGGPWPVLKYLRSSLGDFVAGWTGLFALVAAIAVLGLYVLARTRPPTAILTGLAFAVPAVGLMLAGVSGGAASAPQTRHLIFLLPFFALLVAAGVVRLVALAGSRAQTALALSAAALVAVEVAWGWDSTPTLYAGEPQRRAEARAEAERWLAETSRPSDVLFGYDPLYLGARERGAEIGQTVVPRADPKLALEALEDAPKPLGRGVWVLDGSDGSRTVSNWSRQLEIKDSSPGPEFETRAFGPFLVVRTIEPTVTPDVFLRDTKAVQETQLAEAWDEELQEPYRYWLIANAGINWTTAESALEQLDGTN